MNDKERTDFIHMFAEIVDTGRPVYTSRKRGRWYIEVKDPEIFVFSDVSLGKAIQAAHRLVFR